MARNDSIEQIARDAQTLRVPMTHIARDAEYVPVLRYRIEQEIAAARKRVAALLELDERVAALETPRALPLLDANSDNPLEASIARARASEHDFVRRDVLDAMSDDELRAIVRDGGPAAVVEYASKLLSVTQPDDVDEYEIVDDATGKIVHVGMGRRPLDVLNAYMDVVEIARYPEDGIDPDGLEPDARLWYDDGHGGIDATFSNTNLHVRPVAHDYVRDEGSKS